MNAPNAKRIVAKWLLGALFGTFLIALTSPLFVRSYVPSRLDPLRGVLVLQSGHFYRWRSEGYATTAIGPHGMPGRVSLDATKPANEIRLAIWGDSQAEGVGVADEEKLHRQIERIGKQSQHTITALPLARSGDDAADWLAQIPRVESALAIDMHVILVAEMVDLEAAIATSPDTSPEIESSQLAAQNRIASNVPAFVIQAIRRVLRTSDDTPRTLRFSPGPIAEEPSPTGTLTIDQPDWSAVMQRIRSASDRPILLLYSPRIHRKSLTRIAVDDDQPTGDSLAEIKQAAHSAGLLLRGVTEKLVDSAENNRWPHGFHNGIITQGHLNATGYAIIASEIVSEIELDDFPVH
ncbi:signal peptide protein [Rhodopirellula maiorica SM1]|uniref:Signal peptide protein n=1 Tax=Rhodopirellula maiorica SM1 TaxID=1265738 RepID=M5RNC6_9BACT|nr:hypothetical protein [Rhodopirellula maiorica]EMI15489.1 signal peptide protein [Rhodopirellula maiorica SM1]